MIATAATAFLLAAGCGGGKKHNHEEDHGSVRLPTPEAVAPTTPSTTPATQPPVTEPPVVSPAATPAPAAARPTVDQLALGPHFELEKGPSGSGCSPGDVSKLPDGWWAGQIKGVDGKTIEFDVVCMFHDQAGWSAAQEDGHEEYGEDMYIRNSNPRTFSVTLVSLDSQATLAGSMEAQTRPDVLGSLGDVVELYRLSQHGTYTMMTNQGEVQFESTIWLHTTDGIADYAFMQPGC